MEIKTAEEMKKIVDVNAERDAQIHFERFLKQFSDWKPGTNTRFVYNHRGRVSLTRYEDVPGITSAVFDRLYLKVKERFEPLGYSVRDFYPYLEITFR